MKAKNVFLVVLFAFVISPTFVAAEDQRPQEARNAIAIDVLLPILVPVGILSGNPTMDIPVNIEFQRVIADHLVLLVRLGLGCAWPLPNAPQASSALSLEVDPLVEVDWHPFHEGLKGLNLGLSGIFVYDYYAAPRDAVATKGTSRYRMASGPILGWQFLLPANTIVDLSSGLGFGYNANVDVNGVTTPSSSWELTRGGIFLGFRF